MIFETAGSIYEVHETDSRFRRLHEISPASSRLPVGRWFRFQRMSPVILGEPVRFYWLLEESGEVSRIGLWATGRVTAVLPDTDPSYLVPTHC